MEERKQEILERIDKIMEELEDLRVDIWKIGEEENTDETKASENCVDFAIDELENAKENL
jgi:hypothetical protein